jgi:hypothetical protein
LNDYYGENMKFIGADADIKLKLKRDVYHLICELRFYRLCAVICGPSAAFWGCQGNEAIEIDAAIAWVHSAMLDNKIPCIHGLPFWSDLRSLRRVSKAGNVDKWHHADQNSGKMAFIYDRYFTNLVCLLQLTRCRSENFAMIVRDLDKKFAAPIDSLKRAPAIKVGAGSVQAPAVVVEVTPLVQDEPAVSEVPAAPVIPDRPVVLPEVEVEAERPSYHWGQFDSSNLCANVEDERPLSARNLMDFSNARNAYNIPLSSRHVFGYKCSRCDSDLEAQDRLENGGSSYCSPCQELIEQETGQRENHVEPRRLLLAEAAATRWNSACR